MNEDLLFVCAESSGVPILLCPVEIASYWEGTNEPSDGRVIEADFNLNGPIGIRVDYDRACDVATDYINTIQIGPGKALILGQEIPSMYWIQSETFDGGYLATWVYLPSDEELDYRALVKSLPSGFFKPQWMVVISSM
jgi:hypothetical protein